MQGEPSQIAPSIARIAHLTGLRLLAAAIHADMNINGTMPPPNIESGIMTAQPAPAAACSFLPSVDVNIMIPTKATAVESPARTSKGQDAGRT